MDERVDAITTSITLQLQQISLQLAERVAAVEKVQYEDKGRSGVSEELPGRVKLLEESKSEIKGRSGVSTQLQWAIAGLVGSLMKM